MLLLLPLKLRCERFKSFYLTYKESLWSLKNFKLFHVDPFKMINLQSSIRAVSACLVVISIFSSCSKSPDKEPDPFVQTLEINKSSVTFPASAHTETVSIQSNSRWTISNVPSWINISDTAGAGDKNISLSVEDNITLEEKTGSITITWGENSTKTITVKQSIFDLVLDHDEYLSGGNNQISLTGTGFSMIAAENVVTIAGIPVNVIMSNPTTITIHIPFGQPSGDLVVTVNGRSTQPAKFIYAYVGVLTVIAGGNGQGYTDGPAASAQFFQPRGLFLQENGDLLICDANNNKVRKLSAAGIVSTLPGRLPASADPGAPLTNFDLPLDIGQDADGNIYVVEFTSNLISRIDPNGAVSVFAGNSQFTSVDGDLLNASFKGPGSVYVAEDGSIYVTDGWGHKIRKIAGGQVTTFAGNTNGFANGTGTSALFDGPSDISKHKSGDFLVTDASNRRVRRMTADGVVTTFAGNGMEGENDGSALQASFTSVGQVATDLSGNVFICDANKIRWINPDGKVYTVPLSGESFSGLSGIAVNENMEIFVADAWNNRICKIILQ